jgi:hypothetical protein
MNWSSKSIVSSPTNPSSSWPQDKKAPIEIIENNIFGIFIAKEMLRYQIIDTSCHE